MHEFTKTIHIERPPEAVWPYFIDTDKIQQWVNFESLRQVPEGPVEKGTRWEQTMRFLGKKLEMTDEVIEFEDGRALVLRPVKSPVHYVLEQRLDGDATGTTVAMHFQVGETGGFFGKIAEPMVVRLFEREIGAQLERLKAFAETE